MYVRRGLTLRHVRPHEPDRRPQPFSADRRRRPHRARPPESLGSRARAALLLRRARLRAHPEVRLGRRLPLDGRLPSPHRAQHRGEPGRPAAAGRDDRPLPSGRPLSDARGARGSLPAPHRQRHLPGRRQRPRRERVALPARPRRERRRALLRPPAGGLAAPARRKPGDVHAPARPRGPSRRGRLAQNRPLRGQTSRRAGTGARPYEADERRFRLGAADPPILPAMTPPRREPLVLLAIGAAALVVSAVGPYDRTTWWLEVFPILLGVPLLVATYRRFPLTPLAYRLLFVHALILMIG